MKNKVKKEIRGLKKSFSAASRGVFLCFKNERNFRIHIVVMCYVVLLSFFYQLTISQWGSLIIIFSLVLGAEIFNTAIEAAADFIDIAYSANTRFIKDVSAGAVFIFTIAAAIFGVITFYNIDKLKQLGLFLIYNVNGWTILISIIPAILLIFRKFSIKK